MPTLRISDADAIAYDDAGQGPVIVLVHGSPGTSRAWQPVAERLAARFRVIAPNLPGYGATTRPAGEGPGDSSYAAGLIEALIAEVGPPACRRHSYGGAVALVTAAARPGPSAGAGLFEPVAGAGVAAVARRQPSRADQALSRATARLSSGAPREAAPDHGGLLVRRGRARSDARADSGVLIAHNGHNVRDVCARLFAILTRARPTWADLPVLCAYGSRSSAMMVKIVEAIASHTPRGIIKKIEKANHAMTTTHAEAVATLIMELADGSA